MRIGTLVVAAVLLLPRSVSAQSIDDSGGEASSGGDAREESSSPAPEASTSTEVSAPVETPSPPPAFKPFMVHMNLALNAYTYLGAFMHSSGNMVNDAHLWPGNRLMLLQQLGVGYWVHPNIRLTLTLQLVETATNLPEGASPLTLMGVIPWVTFTEGPFFVGAGPLFAWWSYGIADFAAGIFLAAGFTIPLGGGWALGAAVQGPLLWGQRFSFGLSPALVMAHRF